MMRLKIVILACIFSFIQNAMAMESNDKITRISIATSDAVRYESRWMDNPSRLIIKFKTANVFGQLIDRTELNQGIIKNISVTYYPSEINSHEQRRIKFLTFWLSRNTPYKIWNSKDRIFIDFKNPSLESAKEIEISSTVNVRDLGSTEKAIAALLASFEKAQA